MSGHRVDGDRAEQRAAKIAQAKELLARGVAELQSSEDWKALLKRIACNARIRYRVSRYSFMNQMLVWMQAPEATATAGYRQWQAAGRQVRKGEKGLLIVQPRPWKRERVDDRDDETPTRGVSFGSVFVFDVSQTDGPPVDEPPPLGERLAQDAVFAFGHERLREVALSLEGAPVATIDLRGRVDGDPHGCHGWYCRRTRAIVVLDNGNAAEMFGTLAHEVAHAMLHGAGEHHDTATKEVEAESVAFIVCHAVGLDTGAASFPYVTSWAGTTDASKAVLASGDRITKAANQILAALYAVDEAAGAEAA